MFHDFSEKHQLLLVEDYGDTMAAVQGLLKKHDALETDFVVHKDRCVDICNAGNKLVAAKNHHSPVITQRCQQLQVNIVSFYWNLNIIIYLYVWIG